MTGPARRRSLPATPASAGEARRFVSSVLVGDLAPLAPVATLLVSELVANAVLHTGTPVEVSVAVDGSRARVEVHDGSRQLPVRKNYSTLSGTGRGMVMVDRMAARWGAEADATGKVVWFELDREDAPALGFLEADAR